MKQVSSEHSQFSESIFVNSAEGLLVADRAGVIRKVNPSLCRLLGYAEAELVGGKVDMLVPDAIRGKHHTHRESYHSAPTHRRMGMGRDLKARCKDGAEIPVEIGLSYFEEGEETFVVAMLTDISERLKAEAAIKELNQKLEEKVDQRTAELRRSQQLYALMARNFPEGTISVFDRQLQYIFVEGSGLFALGVKSENLMGTSYLERLPEEAVAPVEEALHRVFKGQAERLELQANGQTYELHAVPLPEEDGSIDRIMVVELNITAKKEVQKGLAKALEQEKELNELKSRFVSMASHEFRTPLSTVLSSTSLLSKYDLTEQQPQRLKHVNRIKSAVDYMTTLMNDFLSLSRLDEGAMEMRVEAFDLVEFLKEVCDEIVSDDKQRANLHHRHEGESQVKLDKNMLKHIVHNLLSNAVKYSGEGKPVHCSSEVKDGLIRLSITDQGIGIPVSEQHRLFERFFRARNATNYQGTGLGLHIVKRYTEALQGTISFETTVDVGTTFTVEIPQNHSHV